MKNEGESGPKAKSNVAYKGAGQMPKEDDVRKLRIFVGESFLFILIKRFDCPLLLTLKVLLDFAPAFDKGGFSRSISTLARARERFETGLTWLALV